MRKEKENSDIKILEEYIKNNFDQDSNFPNDYESEENDGYKFDQSRYSEYRDEDNGRTVTVFLIIDVIKENSDFSFFEKHYEKNFGEDYDPQKPYSYVLDIDTLISDFEQFVDNFKGTLKIGNNSDSKNKQFVKKVIEYYKKNLQIYNYEYGYWWYQYYISSQDIKKVYDAMTPENFKIAAKAFGKDEWIHDSTPEDISALARGILESGTGKHILDLCSGEGRFLTNYISKINSLDYQYKGIELNQSLAIVSGIITKLTGADVIIEQGNIFAFKATKPFDKIFCEPAFNVTLSVPTRKHIISESFADFPLSTSSEWFYLTIGINCLSNTGKLVALLPNGILSNAKDNDFRKQLVENGLIEAVIQLPGGILYGTKIPTNMVVISHDNKEVKFIDATKNIVKSPQANRYQTKENVLNVTEIMALLNSNTQGSTVKIVESSVIKNKGYTLLPERYLNNVLACRQLLNQKLLGDISKTIYRGVQFTKKERDNFAIDPGEKHIVKLVTASNIDCGRIRGSFQKLKDDPSRFEKFYLETNDIVVSARGASVKAGIVEIQNDELMIPMDGVIVVRLSDPDDAFYVCSYLESELGQLLLTEVQTGTAIKLLNASSLKNLRIPFPSKTFLKKYWGDEFRTNTDQLYVLRKQIDQVENRIKTKFNDWCKEW